MKKSKLRYGGQILYIPIEMISSDSMRPRIYFNNDELTDLCASIADAGILKPLTVREGKNGNYCVISGERRLRAAALAGLESVPCLIMKVNDETAAFTALTENLQQSNLNFFELALYVERIHQQFCLSYDVIAEKTGMGLNELSEKMKLLAIPFDLRIKIVENNLTEKHARELIKLNDTDKEKLVDEIIEKRLTVSATRERVKQMLSAGITKKEQKTVTYFKDVTVFVNTIDKALSAMEKSGIKANSSKREENGYIEYCVKIPK